MKIILKAFGYLESKIMEVPENTTPKFELALTQPIQYLSDFNGDNLKNISPINTIAEFEWTGKWFVAPGGLEAREYILTDIHKQ